MENEIMTVGEVAKYLQLSKATIYKYAKSGQIRFTLIGNKQRYSKRLVLEDFEKFDLKAKPKTKK
jgi:excisionase family DNA binding protein